MKALPKKMGRPPRKLDRVITGLRKRIQSAEWQPGSLLPGEVELSQDLKVSRMTLRSGLALLEKEGIIERKQGKGTFVAGPRPSGKRINHTLAILVYKSDEALDADSYRHQLMLGMQSALQDSGFSSSIHSIPRGEKIIDFIRKHETLAMGWGGVLTYSPLIDLDSLAWLERMSVPIVSLTTPPAVLKISYVDLDSFAGGEMAMRHLLEKGRRRPVVLDSWPAGSSGAARLAGYRKALSDFQVTVPEKFFIERRDPNIRSSQKAAFDLVLPLLTAKTPVDSVIVYGEHPTIGVYQAIEKSGRRVGKDISVVHYNDYPWLREVLHPAPTAVRQPFERVAYEATLLLQQKIRRTDSTTEHRIIKPELIIRES